MVGTPKIDVTVPQMTVGDGPVLRGSGQVPTPPPPASGSFLDLAGLSGLNIDAIDWMNYVNSNDDLRMAGFDADRGRQHFINYGHDEGRSLGYQTAGNQGQYYNLRDGTPVGPTNAGEMNAFVGNNFTNHTGFNSNTFAGTGGGVTDPTKPSIDAVGYVQNGNSVADLAGLGVNPPQRTIEELGSDLGIDPGLFNLDVADINKFTAGGGKVGETVGTTTGAANGNASSVSGSDSNSNNKKTKNVAF
jgi:hypothetical protein